MAKMPVVVISGYLSQDAGNIILDGMADFLEKPVRASALVAAVRAPTAQTATP